MYSYSHSDVLYVNLYNNSEMRQYKLLRGYVLDISSEATQRLLYIRELSNEVDEIIADIEERNKKPTFKQKIINKWNTLTPNDKLNFKVGMVVYPLFIVIMIKMIIEIIEIIK